MTAPIQATALSIFQSAAEVLRPPRRMPVAEAAAKYLKIWRPGGDSTNWDTDLAPYMVEPMNRIADRHFEAVVFVGPARTGKTFSLLLGGLAYSIVCDPADTLIVQMTEHNAREFSKDDLSRTHRASPELQARLSPYRQDDNVFDKQYRNGMRLSVGWPSVRQLSSRTLRRVFLTDYDRMDDNVDGEGSPFELARKRTQTYLSSGKVVVESSPGRTICDPKWRMKDPHDPPPCTGIFSLYAQGTRSRWYWPCPYCGEYFAPIPYIESFQEKDGEIYLACPCCDKLINKSHKRPMNLSGRWVAAGQTIDRNGVVSGAIPETTIASYWMTGAQAAYQGWASLYRKYHAALSVLESTGSEEDLKTITGGDIGMAYRPRSLSSAREASVLIERKEEWDKRVIPAGVLYLLATIDVQANRFVVQVVGYGRDRERWLIDRYNISGSPSRVDSAGKPEPINPPRYIEDWAALIPQVLRKPYPFADDPDRGLLPVLVGVDSGGKAGSTERAYAFWHQCRALGLAPSVLKLLKGDSHLTNQRIQESFPDNTQRSNRKANARGKIPLYRLNSNMLKDTLAADLERTEPGPGYIHFPEWLGDWFFDELTNEFRDAKGWHKTGRNEAIDLLYYAEALNLLLQSKKPIDWNNPPHWVNPDKMAVSMEGGTEITKTPNPASAQPESNKDQEQRKNRNGSFINRPSGQTWIRNR